jgi:hypothetical protein
VVKGSLLEPLADGYVHACCLSLQARTTRERRAQRRFVSCACARAADVSGKQSGSLTRGSPMDHIGGLMRPTCALAVSMGEGERLDCAGINSARRGRRDRGEYLVITAETPRRRVSILSFSRRVG